MSKEYKYNERDIKVDLKNSDVTVEKREVKINIEYNKKAAFHYVYPGDIAEDEVITKS